MNQLKIGKGLKYIVVGAGVVNIFLQLANFVMLFYSVVLKDTSISLVQFFLVGLASLAFTFYVVGYVWRNHSDMFRADRMVDVETDPYNVDHFTPLMVPVWEAFVQLCEANDIQGEALDQIKHFIKVSKGKK